MKEKFFLLYFVLCNKGFHLDILLKSAKCNFCQLLLLYFDRRVEVCVKS